MGSSAFCSVFSGHEVLEFAVTDVLLQSPEKFIEMMRDEGPIHRKRFIRVREGDKAVVSMHFCFMYAPDGPVVSFFG